MEFELIEEKSAFFFSATDTLMTYKCGREGILVDALKELGIQITVPQAKIGFLAAELQISTRGYTIKPKEEREKLLNDFSKAVISNCGIKDDGRIAAFVANRFRSSDIWIAYPDAEPTLKSLKKRGCILGVIANGERIIREALRKLSLSQYLDDITLSEEAGVEKPDPRIYQMVIEKFGLRPQECVFVGDTIDVDLRGARMAGMSAVWIDRNRLAKRVGDITKIEVLTDVEFIFPIKAVKN